MIKNNNAFLTASEARARLSYNPDTGILIWLDYAPNGKTWNKRFAGKPAGKPGRSGYLRVVFNGHSFMLHRVAWLIVFGEWPSDELDHRNGQKTDNRLLNLRDASHSLNMSNRCYAKSGAKGVYKSGHKWRARIVLDGKKKDLGSFYTIEAASAAYQSADRSRTW